MFSEVVKKISFFQEDEPNGKCARYTGAFHHKNIHAIRDQIYSKFRRFKDSVYTMTEGDIRDMFLMYDNLYFDGDMTEFMKNHKYTLEFRVSTKTESTFVTEGFCNQRICNYTMTIPVDFFKGVKGRTNVAGQWCDDQLSCLQRVLEHELSHLIVFIFCADPTESDQHGKLFMKIVRDLFEHTDFRHYIF